MARRNGVRSPAERIIEQLRKGPRSRAYLHEHIKLPKPAINMALWAMVTKSRKVLEFEGAYSLANPPDSKFDAWPDWPDPAVAWLKDYKAEPCEVRHPWEPADEVAA